MFYSLLKHRHFRWSVLWFICSPLLLAQIVFVLPMYISLLVMPLHHKQVLKPEGQLNLLNYSNIKQRPGAASVAPAQSTAVQEAFLEAFSLICVHLGACTWGDSTCVSAPEQGQGEQSFCHNFRCPD